MKNNDDASEGEDDAQKQTQSLLSQLSPHFGKTFRLIPVPVQDAL